MARRTKRKRSRQRSGGLGSAADVHLNARSANLMMADRQASRARRAADSGKCVEALDFAMSAWAMLEMGRLEGFHLGDKHKLNDDQIAASVRSARQRVIKRCLLK